MPAIQSTSVAERPQIALSGDDDKIAGAIAPLTPATSKDARAVARYRVEHRHTEAGNAERWVASCGDTFRYHSERRVWLTWGDHRWVEDKDGAAVRTMLARVRELGYEDPAFVLASEKANALRAALEIAASLHTADGASLRVREVELNTKRHLLPVANGVVNLRTGILRVGDPGDLMVHGSPVRFVREAPAPTWDRVIDEITCGDKELARFLQRWAGYCLTGETREQKSAFLLGEGGNGKGIYTKYLARVAGDTATTIPTSCLILKREESDGPDPHLAKTAGKRLALASEGRQDARLDEAKIKNITGEETLTGRMLHENPIEWVPTAKFTVSSNHRPTIIGTDRGIWRRILLVPMRATYSDGGEPGTLPIDPDLDAKLESELEGILWWAIQGAIDWYQSGLAVPAAVTTAVGEYRAEMDRVGSFIEDTYVRCFLADGTTCDHRNRVKAADVFRAYQAWCAENGVDALSMNGLSREMGKKGIELVQSSGRWRIGIRPKTAADRVGGVDKAVAQVQASAAPRVKAAVAAAEPDDGLPF